MWANDAARLAADVEPVEEAMPDELPDLMSIAKTSFVKKLYDLVMNEPDEIVAFQADGSAFEVKDPKKLEAIVLPKYFRHSRFQSLVRQLNFYNFKKISKERHMWIYHHELFHRDKPALLEGLKRKTSQMPEREGMAEDAAPKPMRRSHSVTFPSDADAPFRRSASDSTLQGTGAWSETFDEASGQCYYWNSVTGQCQWETPQHWSAEDSMRCREQRMQERRDSLDDGSSSSDGGAPDSPSLKRAKRGGYNDDAWRGDDARRSAAAAAAAATNPHPHLGEDMDVGMGGGPADDEAAAADSSWSVDLYYSEDSEIEADSLQWEELQVSTDALGSLQRALYERRTAPALVACVTFALRTTPQQHQKPSRFLSAVKEKLNSHSELWREIQKYREALEPSRGCGSQHCTGCEGMYVVDRAGDGAGDAAGDAAEDEMCAMREFMAFVVTRLQHVRDLCAEHSFPMEAEHNHLLNECLRLWWKLASRFM